MVERRDANTLLFVVTLLARARYVMLLVLKVFINH